MHHTCHTAVSVLDYEYSKLGNRVLWKKFNKEYNIIGELGVKSRPFFYGAFSTIILPETLHFESAMKLDLIGTYDNEQDPVYEF
jgi:hypothetical protein